MFEAANALIDKLKVATSLTLLGKTVLRVQVKTADYTVVPADSGTIFSTYGAAGAVIFTLPSNPVAGLHFWFLGGTANDLTIAAATADTLYAWADSAADSVTTTDIGVLTLVIADGNKWYAVSFANANIAAATMTITT